MFETITGKTLNIGKHGKIYVDKYPVCHVCCDVVAIIVNNNVRAFAGVASVAPLPSRRRRNEPRKPHDYTSGASSSRRHSRGLRRPETSPDKRNAARRDSAEPRPTHVTHRH